MSPAAAFIPWDLLLPTAFTRGRAPADQHDLIAGVNDFAALLHSTLLGEAVATPEMVIHSPEAEAGSSEANPDAVSPIGEAGKPSQPTALHRAVEGEPVAAGVQYLTARFPGNAVSSLLRPSPSAAQIGASDPVPSLPIAVSPPPVPAASAQTSSGQTAAFAPFPELTATGTRTGLVEPTASVPWRGRLRLTPQSGASEVGPSVHTSGPNSASLPPSLELGWTSRVTAGGETILLGPTPAGTGVAEVMSAHAFVALRVPRTPVPPSLQDVESDVERPQGDVPLARPPAATRAMARGLRGRASLIPASRSEVTEPAGNEAFAGVWRPAIENGYSVQFVPAGRTALVPRTVPAGGTDSSNEGSEHATASVQQRASQSPVSPEGHAQAAGRWTQTGRVRPSRLSGKGLTRPLPTTSGGEAIVRGFAQECQCGATST